MRRRTTHEVLEGVAENVKSSRLGRFFSAIFSTTVQELHPTARQKEHLAKASAIKDHQTDSTFGICYMAWRHENISIAALSMVLRVGFTIWSVVLDFQSVSTFELTCHDRICNVTGGCTACSLGERCLPKVSDAQMRDLRTDGACPAYFGIAPTAAFPLIPDHMRAAMKTYHVMVLAQTTIRLVCEISAILCVWLAWGAFVHFHRSQVWVRVAFGFALVPPFVLALTFPLQSGINTGLFLERMCHDVTSLISSPGATPNATQWVLNLDLPPRSEFCSLPPAQWGPKFEQALKDKGVLAKFNATDGEFQCPVSAARKAECMEGVCAQCFGDVPSSRLTGDPFAQAAIPGNPANLCDGQFQQFGSQRRRTFHEAQHYPGTPFRYNDPFPPNPPQSPEPPHVPPSPPPSPRPPTPPNIPGVDPNDRVRNPCLDYVAISQLCIGRDERKAQQLQTVCPAFTSLGDAEKTKGLEGVGCTLQGTRQSNLRTGGYADESSLCGLLGDDLFNSLSTFDNCKRCYLPMRQMAQATDSSTSFTVPPGATETTNCVEYCTAVLTQDLLGSRIAPGFVPDLCAGQEVLGHLTNMISLVDVFRAFEVAVGVTILLSTIVTLSPAALSLVLGTIKAGKVLKASLPWVRLPSFQILLSTAVVLPLIIAIMASFFQVAADGWSLGFSLAIVASFLSNWPTHYFVQAKSYHENASEMRRRGYIQSTFLLLALILLGLWLGLSARLRQVLLESGFVDLRQLGAYRTPSAPVWILLTVVLDFLGKSVLSKVFFTDLLLLVTARTELAESSSAQRVMRDQAAVLYSFTNDTHETEVRLRRNSVAGGAKGSVAQSGVARYDHGLDNDRIAGPT